MISVNDFEKKQIIFVISSEGEKLQIKNDNLLVTDSNGKTKIQVTCYRLFLVNIIGNCSITSVLISKARKYGFFIAMYSYGFHLYQIIGATKDGNTLLKKKQYKYEGLELAKLIVKNKISCQIQMIDTIRNISDDEKTQKTKIIDLLNQINEIDDSKSLLAIEGLTAKMYFKIMFNSVNWQGRQPRIKRDFVNSTLDIGYTLLFNFIDAILSCFGFDTFIGIYHTQFYMRKSLVCDIIEPFRPIIDKTVRNCININKIKESDFEVIKNQYVLKYNQNVKYIRIFMEPIINNKELIFKYIQKYYRSFMKDLQVSEYPFIMNGDITYGINKL